MALPYSSATSGDKALGEIQNCIKGRPHPTSRIVAPKHPANHPNPAWILATGAAPKLTIGAPLPPARSSRHDPIRTKTSIRGLLQIPQHHDYLHDRWRVFGCRAAVTVGCVAARVDAGIGTAGPGGKRMNADQFFQHADAVEAALVEKFGVRRGIAEQWALDYIETMPRSEARSPAQIAQEIFMERCDE